MLGAKYLKWFLLHMFKMSWERLPQDCPNYIFEGRVLGNDEEVGKVLSGLQSEVVYK